MNIFKYKYKLFIEYFIDMLYMHLIFHKKIDFKIKKIITIALFNNSKYNIFFNL